MPLPQSGRKLGKSQKHAHTLQCVCALYIYIYIYIRGVMVHKHGGSVCTSVLTSRFGMFSVQQEVKKKTKHIMQLVVI